MTDKLRADVIRLFGGKSEQPLDSEMAKAVDDAMQRIAGVIETLKARDARPLPTRAEFRLWRRDLRELQRAAAAFVQREHPAPFDRPSDPDPYAKRMAAAKGAAETMSSALHELRVVALGLYCSEGLLSDGRGRPPKGGWRSVDACHFVVSALVGLVPWIAYPVDVLVKDKEAERSRKLVQRLCALTREIIVCAGLELPSIDSMKEATDEALERRRQEISLTEQVNQVRRRVDGALPAALTDE